MANEFLITDVVDKKAIQSLKELNQQLLAAKETYVNVAKEIGTGIRIPVGNFDELSGKAKAYEDAMAKLAEAQRTINELQKQYTTVLNNVNKKVREAVAEEKRKKEEKQKLKITTQEAIELSKKEVHSIAEAEAANKRLRLAVKEITDAEDQDGKIRAQLNSAINVNTAYIKRNRDALVQNKMTVGDYKEQIKAAMIELKNGTNTMKNFGIVAKGFGEMLKTDIGNGISEVGMGIGNMIKGFVGAQAVLSGIQSLTSALKNGAKTAIDFQAANSSLAAILQTTADQTKNLQLQARELGATTRYSASEATALQIELAKLGFTVDEISNSTKHILLFSQATGSSLPDAAALAGAALRMFNADTRETERYVSAMAVATSKSALSFSYLQTALPIVGPVAKSFNFSIEETLALLGKLADAGFDASSAATATRNILLNLADANGKLSQRLGEPVRSLPDLAAGLRKLRDEGVDLNETLELTDKRSVSAFNTFITSADKLTDLKEALTGVESGLSDMASTMEDNTQGALANLESAWEELMLTIYGSTGAIRDFVNFCTDAVNSVTQLFKSTGEIADETIYTTTQRAKEAADELSAKNEEVVERTKNAYIAAGMSETEALKKAKDERLAILQQLYEQEAALRDKYEQENIGENEKYKNSSFWKQSLGLEKTNAQYEKAIAESWNKYIEHLGYATSLEAQMESVRKIGTTPEPKGGDADTTETTEKDAEKAAKKEREAAEKAKKERLRIQQELQQAEVEGMEESREKELAQISLNYNKRMAAIEGNSENEQKLREQLAENMSRDVAAAEKEWEETHRKQNADRKLKEIEQHYATQSIIETEAVQKSLNELAEKYKRGEIDKEKYEEKKTELTEKYGIKQAKIAIDILETQLLVSELTEEEKLKIQEKISKARIALMEKERELIEKNTEKEAEARKKQIEAMKDAFDDMEGAAEEVVPGLGKIFDAINDIFEKVMAKEKVTVEDILASLSTVALGVSEIIGSVYERKLEQLEEEEEANEEANEKELERIDELAQRGAISEEEAEARKRAAEDKTAKKNEEIAKKKAELQTKQAKLEKATNIITTIMNTAVAIMKAFSQGGIFATPMAAMIGAMGAIQLATIIAQPIPKYAKGTQGHKGGMAIVGDGGKQEAVITNDGVWATPDVPTLVNLPKGAVVLPDLKEITSPKGMHSDLLLLMDRANKQKGDRVTVNVNNDYTKLEKRMDANSSELRQIKKLLRAQGRSQERVWIYGRV